MIGISIIVISIGTAVVQFDRDDLISFNPNYNLINEYQAVEDPLTHYNYIPYGEDVLGSLIGFVEFLAPFGEFAQAGWTLFFQIASTNLNDPAQGDDSFLNTFGSDRTLSLSQMRFSSLKATPILFLLTSSPITICFLIFLFIQMFFNSTKFSTIITTIFII
jgi:hypothetical protein